MATVAMYMESESQQVKCQINRLNAVGCADAFRGEREIKAHLKECLAYN